MSWGTRSSKQRNVPFACEIDSPFSFSLTFSHLKNHVWDSGVSHSLPKAGFSELHFASLLYSRGQEGVQRGEDTAWASQLVLPSNPHPFLHWLPSFLASGTWSSCTPDTHLFMRILLVPSSSDCREEEMRLLYLRKKRYLPCGKHSMNIQYYCFYFKYHY